MAGKCQLAFLYNVIVLYLYLITFLGVTSRKGDMIKNLEHDNPLRNVTLEKLCLLNIFPGILCQYAPEEEKNKTMVELCVASLPSCNKGRRLTGCDFCILFLQLSQLIQSTQSSSSETLLDTSEKSPLSGKKRNFLIHSWYRYSSTILITYFISRWCCCLQKEFSRFYSYTFWNS